MRFRVRFPSIHGAGALKNWKHKKKGAADRELILNQCVHDSCRITVLTPCLVRLEYAPDGAFCDEQTERVITRAFPTPEVRSVRTRCGIQLWTEQLEIYWDLRVPDLGGITIRQLRISGNKRAIWRYGEHPGNLRGTARTLDRADGAIDLEDGVMSVNGISILDDSASVALDASGARRIRDPRTVDLYVFGYGHAYRLALRDYLILTGKPPMIPQAGPRQQEATSRKYRSPAVIISILPPAHPIPLR